MIQHLVVVLVVEVHVGQLELFVGQSVPETKVTDPVNCIRIPNPKKFQLLQILLTFLTINIDIENQVIRQKSGVVSRSDPDLIIIESRIRIRSISTQ